VSARRKHKHGSLEGLPGIAPSWPEDPLLRSVGALGSVEDENRERSVYSRGPNCLLVPLAPKDVSEVGEVTSRKFGKYDLWTSAPEPSGASQEQIEGLPQVSQGAPPLGGSRLSRLGVPSSPAVIFEETRNNEYRGLASMSAQEAASLQPRGSGEPRQGFGELIRVQFLNAGPAADGRGQLALYGRAELDYEGMQFLSLFAKLNVAPGRNFYGIRARMRGDRLIVALRLLRPLPDSGLFEVRPFSDLVSNDAWGATRRSVDTWWREFEWEAPVRAHGTAGLVELRLRRLVGKAQSPVPYANFLCPIEGK